MRNNTKYRLTNRGASLVIFSLVLATFALVAGCDESDAGAFNRIEVNIHDEVETLLVVSWSQDRAMDQVWIRYSFEDDVWFETPKKPLAAGEQTLVVLGVPEKTEVTLQMKGAVGEKTLESGEFTGTTGSIPVGMPRPTVEYFDEFAASQNRWLFGSVDSSFFADDYYAGPFWLYIIDRKGRIVWYYSDLGNNPIFGFPRIARDGRYIFFGNRTPFDLKKQKDFVPWVTKMTLDHGYYEEIEMPLSDNVDMTNDGSLLYNTEYSFDSKEAWLMEHHEDGSARAIWNCGEVFGHRCYSNTVNWHPESDTVLMSFPYLNTVVEISRETGELVGQYGDEPGSYAFDSDLWGFDFQHYANITPEGTLMVSSHLPDVEGKHAFMEFEIDRENEILKEKWIYREGDEWAMFMGEAHRVPDIGGNVLANYGTGGVIKEITPSKYTAWYVKWDAPFEDDDHNKMVGHCTLIDDLYALNQGPE